MTTVDVLLWRPDALLHVARAVDGAAARLGTAEGDLAGVQGSVLHRSGGWNGRAAARAAGLLVRRVAALQALRGALAVVRDALGRAAIQVAAAQQQARRAAVVADVAHLLGVPGWAAIGATELLLGPLAASALPDAERAATSCARGFAEATDRCRAVGRAAQADRPSGRRVGPQPAPRLPAAASPDTVAEWWARLGPASWGASGGLLASDLVRPGLPATVRDDANRYALRARLARRLPTPEARDAERVDEAVCSDLAAASSLRDPVDGAGVPVRLLVDDPSAWHGRGSVAVALGDPDHADNVVYLVPGFGTSTVDDMSRLTDDAWRIYRTARRLAAGPTVAVVAWLAYPAPGPAQVAFDDAAAVGARRLADEVEGLRAARGSAQPHVTVVGHSYGSLVAATAATDRPGAVDDLVVIGSPGLGEPTAFDVPVPRGHLWVGAASGDPVSRLSWFGPDPAGAGFGGRRFHAEAPPGSSLLGEHTSYLTAGSASLAAIAAVSVGRGQRLSRARGRYDHGYLGAAAELAFPTPVLRLPDPWTRDVWAQPPTFDDPETGQRWAAAP